MSLGESEEPAAETRPKKVEPVSGTGPKGVEGVKQEEKEGSAEGASPEEWEGPAEGVRKEEKAGPAEGARPQTGKPAQAPVATGMKRPAEGLWPEEVGSEDKSCPGERNGRAEMARPEELEGRETDSAERM